MNNSMSMQKLSISEKVVLLPDRGCPPEPWQKSFLLLCTGQMFRLLAIMLCIVISSEIMFFEFILVSIIDCRLM